MPTNEQVTRLFLQHHAMLAEYIRALIRNPTDAEDVFQDAAVAILHKCVVPDDPAVFSQWARGVAKNLALHFWRKQKRDRLVPDSRLLESFDLAYTEADSQHDLWQKRRAMLASCLEKLGEKHRQIMDMCYVQNLTSDQMASRLNRSAVAVRMMLCRLRANITECIEKRVQEGNSLT